MTVDYSLSPEAPFGVALQECYYAYAWALSNAALLNTTAETVAVSGDSAGGNLSMAVTMKVIKVRETFCRISVWSSSHEMWLRWRCCGRHQALQWICIQVYARPAHPLRCWWRYPHASGIFSRC